MSALTFSLIAASIVVLLLTPGIVHAPIRPRIFNLQILFSTLFLVVFVQPIFVSESIFGMPVSQWLYVTPEQKSSALAFLMAYLLFFLVGAATVPKKITYSHIQISYKPVTVGVATAVVVGLSFLIYVFATGGVEQFIFNHREEVYKDQWSVSREAQLKNLVRTLTGFVMMVAAIIGGYLYATHEGKRRPHKWLYALLPLPGTLVKLALLSRGVFLFYMLYWISLNVVTRYQDRLFLLRAILIALVVAGGILFGLAARGGSILDGEALLLAASMLINGISNFLDVYALSQTSQGGG